VAEPEVFLRSVLAAASIEIQQLRLSRANVEDAFVSLVRAEQLAENHKGKAA
jgi:hypothetical protein